MIKIISFDLDGTLVKTTYADKVWLEGIPVVLAKEKRLPLKKAKEHVFNEYEKIGKNRIEWYDIDWWFNKFELKEKWQNILEKYRTFIEPYPETLETVERLSKKFDLIIISNAKKDFIHIQLEETMLKPYFKHVFSSFSDFNEVKKSSDVYKEIVSFLMIKPNEMIHVGDNKEFDYISPRKIGIKSFYLDRGKIGINNGIINSLSHLEKLAYS
jgi:putative hydrolase of the HAD superfamily